MTPKTPRSGKVGYKSPPEATRFTKGKSGNPKGRPKGTQNFKTDLQNLLEMPVPIDREGQPRQKISTQLAVLMRLREKALKGDVRAVDKLLQLAQRHGEDQEQPGSSEKLSPQEEGILEEFDRRMREAEQSPNIRRPIDDLQGHEK